MSDNRDLKFNKMNIVLSSDDNYIQHLCTTIASILKNSNKNSELCFYILHKGLSQDSISHINYLKHINKCQIKLIEIDYSMFADFPLLEKTCYNLARETYFRYLLPKIFKDEERALYLDSDIIVNGDIQELYNIPFESNCVLAVEDSGYEYTKDCIENLNLERYFNSGVMLFNIPKCIEENISDKLFEWTNILYKENKLKYMDQCVLNYVLKDKVKFIDIKYNFQACIFFDINESYKIFGKNKIDNLMNNPYLIHYTANKPWKNSLHPLANYYWEYLKYTDFRSKAYAREFKNMLKTIFSVQNKGVHKVITLLGMKFKFKTKKLIEKHEIPCNSFLEDIFSVKNNGMHKVVTILGLKLKIKTKKLLHKSKATTIDVQQVNDKLNIKLDYLELAYKKTQEQNKTILYMDWHIFEPDTNAGDRASYSYFKAFLHHGFNNISSGSY